MGNTMDKNDETKLKSMAAELAKNIKSEKDLCALTQQLVKLTVETALGAEMEEYLCYEKHDPAGRGSNSRNGSTSKRLKGRHGDVEIDTPRDRSGTFDLQFVRKGRTRLAQMDDQILALYAKGLGTRDIVDAFKEMYDAYISVTLVSKVTDRVIESVVEWQDQPLDRVYPIIYLDCIVLKIRQNQAAHQQINVCGSGHQHGRSEGAVGLVAGRDGRGQILALR